MRHVTVAVIIGILAATPCVGQAPEERDGGPTIRATATAGLSLRDSPAGFRFGKDVRALALRLQLARRGGIEPWVEVGGFDRVDIDCAAVGDAPCNETGITARAGASALLGASGGDRPGVRGELLLGLGAGFADETMLSYLLGLEAQWAQWPGILPVIGVRYERFPGLTNVGMAHAGIRIQL
jgi:hypothetical protein